jgi:hypothetical protein
VRNLVFVAASPGVSERALAWARIDFSPRHRPPEWWRLVLATVLSVGLSLAADAALVSIGTGLFPTTKGYVHFQFHDYARLTVIGVLIACAAWPVVARISSAPRWLFFRLAILVTLVLLLPDLYIWHQGQPAKAVLVLMTMHIAIALVTYNLLVRLAPARATRPSGTARSAAETRQPIPGS